MPHQNDSLEDFALRVVAELKSVTALLEAKLTHATKQDLQEMETRLMEAIKANQSVDLTGLQSLLERSKSEAAALANITKE